MNTALFPGSFDPLTKGHEDIVLRVLPLFEKIIIAIGKNNEKNPLFTLEQRINWMKECFQKENKVEIISYNGLTINLCQEVNAQYIIRGIRNSHDFLYEKDIAQINKVLAPQIETIFLTTNPEYAAISSTIIRDVYLQCGDFAQFMPNNVIL